MAVSARRGAPLTREEIYAAAWRLIDADGVEGLSMRKLAAELDVNPMSLYHHVENKTALMQEICLRVGTQLAPPPDDGLPWQDQIRALGDAYRELARRHPSLWRYVFNNPEVMSTRRGGMWDVLHRLLRLAGVPEEDVPRLAEILSSFVSGFIFSESTGGVRPDAWDDAVTLLIGGLEAYTGR
ncbi:TetR/AcrR family transcriptional regulator [Nonomuraea sp. NPDC050790]|uniref:TetR/AcrR family transcriptional regulator n=1 Tax=Nonomuraea sp. NPDC050790 TaxID=3364371 RepID=UPI003796DB61